MSSELTSAFPSQRLSQDHSGSTSCDYQGLPQFLSICHSCWTISHLLLCVIGRHVLHQVVTNNDTIHPQAMYLLEDNYLN